jgi:integrase/recombinase XerD
VVWIIRKGPLPAALEVVPRLRDAAADARAIALREPRPVGFPLLFSSNLDLIEPAVAYLHEHAIQRAHTPDTVNTYLEILYDWFDALEQSGILWSEADAVDLVAYRNRMLTEPSTHTGRPYGVRTVNHRVRGVLRFYDWMVRNHWLDRSELAGRTSDFAVSRRTRVPAQRDDTANDRSLFVLRQFESLPRPLSSSQLRELLARLPAPYDLMARWQLYTGLRVGELLRLSVNDVHIHEASRGALDPPAHHVIDVIRKGRKSGYVIASASLLEETDAYLMHHRDAWIKRARRMGRRTASAELFVNSRGTSVRKNSYQQVIADTGDTCGFRATTHLLRASFACMMLARLERLAKQGAAINPLLIVKVLMGHERIDTTDRYLRAIAVDMVSIDELLDSLLEPR